jgi:hypothetical protein
MACWAEFEIVVCIVASWIDGTLLLGLWTLKFVAVPGIMVLQQSKTMQLGQLLRNVL